MGSFDVVNKVNMEELSNAVGNAKKELAQRYDFRGSNTEIELDAKAMQIVATTEDEMKVEAVRDMLITHAVRRKLDAACLEFKEAQPAGGKKLRVEVQVKDGIERDIARKITKDVKDSKIKVQVAIQGEELRITGKKRDDLQATIALIKTNDYGIPLQYENMRD
jgi:uncharacterized protein YajQ (UPF0234 family)